LTALNEEMLNSWLDLSVTIVNEKLVSHIPYNEALICNILNRHAKKAAGKPLTASALCALTRMQKSLMNRTLTSMEKRGLICRERSKEDKRKIFVRLNPVKDNPYFRQHKKTLALVDRIIDKMGVEKAKDVMDTLQLVTSVASGALK